MAAISAALVMSAGEWGALLQNSASTAARIFRFGFAEAVEDHIGALRGEAAGDGQPNSGGGAGDDGCTLLSA